MEKTKPILITGAQGFIGKNLTVSLQGRGYSNLLLIDKDTPKDVYQQAVRDAGFIFHLAGVNRPQKPEEFTEGNVDTVKELLGWMKQFRSRAPLVVSSSIQALQDNPYGRSKKAGEDVLLEFASKEKHPIYIYRLSNVFGKWSRPHYNSVVATFCYQIARNLPITIHDPQAKIALIYIDDVIHELIQCLEGKVTTIDGILRVLPEYEITVGELANQLKHFRESRVNLHLENQAEGFPKKLYATYLSYLEESEFIYDVTMHRDTRGSFTELLKSKTEGQFSVNISKPGITKGNHYHHTKNEKFIVVSGEAIIRFRKVGELKVIEYPVSGNKIQVVDIPPGYVHHIENVGATDLVTLMWASELFDQENPDTYPMEVFVK